MKTLSKALFAVGAILMLSAVGNDDMDPHCSMVKILAFMCGGMLSLIMGALVYVYAAQKTHRGDRKTAPEVGNDKAPFQDYLYKKTYNQYRGKGRNIQ